MLLLPTSHIGEEILGDLVEAKIAGLSALVSDHLYRAEIVEDGVSGIVLKENTAETFAKAVKALDKDRKMLYLMMGGAKNSAEDYYIENYIPMIIKQLK